MEYEDWKKEVEEYLYKSLGYPKSDIDEEQMENSYNGGDTPLEFSEWYVDRYIIEVENNEN